MEGAKKDLNAQSGNHTARSGPWVVEQLEELVCFLDEALEKQSWQTMEAVNDEMQAFLARLDQSQLGHPGVQACLGRLKKRFDHFIQVCNDHKASCQNALQTQHRREQAVYTYRKTGGLQGE
ncbi:MAG: hypothetical protein ACPG5T_00670 [Endozoicomonas sp.]